MIKKLTILCVMAVPWPLNVPNDWSKVVGLKLKAYLVICMLCMFVPLQTFAQDGDLVFGALRVGDKLPAEFWTQSHLIYSDGKASRQTLTSYKDKLLVLDFWATWCSSCVNKFRTIEKLQAEFGAEASFLLVNTKNTRDSVTQIDGLLSGKKYNGAAYLLTTVYGDSYFHQLFPHGYMPYYVIISPSGEVRAVVPAELLTASNIRVMIDAYAKRTGKGGGNG